MALKKLVYSSDFSVNDCTKQQLEPLTYIRKKMLLWVEQSSLASLALNEGPRYTAILIKWWRNAL